MIILKKKKKRKRETANKCERTSELKDLSGLTPYYIWLSNGSNENLIEFRSHLSGRETADWEISPPCSSAASSRTSVDIESRAKC